MATDDRRMHEGRSRSLGEQHRDHSEREDPYTPHADSIGRESSTPRQGATEDVEGEGSTADREQGSALGGDVATRSSTRETPEDERFQ